MNPPIFNFNSNQTTLIKVDKTLETEKGLVADFTASLFRNIDEQFNGLLKSINEITEKVQTLKGAVETDREKNSELFTGVMEGLNDGTVSLQCGLAHADKVIPRYGAPLFTISERTRRISALTHLNVGNETLGPGCSTLLDLFSDFITSKFLDCLKDRSLRMSDQLMIIFANRKTRPGRRSELAWTYFANIESLLGTLCCQGTKGGNFRSSISYEAQGTPPSDVQGAIVKTIAELKGQVQLINFEGSANGRQLIEAVHLLQDIACQEMHLLFEPVKSAPEFSMHFRRLKQRLSVFKKMVSDIDRFFPEGFKLHRDNKYKKLLQADQELMLDFCRAIEEEISAIAKSDHPSPVQLRKLYQKLYKMNQDGNKLELYTQLALEINASMKKDPAWDKDPENSNMIFFLRIIAKFEWTKESIYSESITVLLRELTEASEATNQEMDVLISNLINVTRTIEQSSTASIEDLLKKCKERTELDFSNKTLVEVLETSWKNDFNFTQNHYAKTLTKLLEERRKRCRNPESSVWDRTLALRDGLHVFAGGLFRVTAAIEETLSKLKGLIIVPEEFDGDVKQLFNEMYSLNEIYREAVSASIVGIESLLGRCFDKAEHEANLSKLKAELDFRARKENSEKAFNELYAKSTAKAVEPSKKKRKKKKSPSPANTPPSPPAAVEVPGKAAIAVEEKTAATLEGNERKLENLLEPKAYLKQIQKGIDELLERKLSGANDYFRLHWRNAQLSNLRTWCFRLEEIGKFKTFNCSSIFDETDLMRRMIEASLEILLAQYSLASEIPEVGHQLHLLVKMILSKGIDEKSIPAEIRNVVWQLRHIPYELSQANACVNYLHSTELKIKHLSKPAQTLIRFLQMVEEEGKTNQPNERMQSALQEKHKERLKRTLYFIQKIINVALDPADGIDGDLPSHITFGEDLELNAEMTLIPSPETKESPFESEDLKNIDEPVLSISNRKEALSVIENALSWIAIRSMNPVEGRIDVVHRTLERNAALKNAALCLQRLRGKLTHDRSVRPFDTICVEWSMVQRSLKELTVAALFHGSYYPQSMHVMEELDLRHHNNPRHLMKVLKAHSRNGKQLPFLAPWMGSSHHVLCYPTAIKPEEDDSPLAKKLREQLSGFYALSERKKKFAGGFALVEAGQEAATLQDHIKNVQTMIDEDEKEKTYPALMAIIQVLKYGMTVKGSLLQSL